MLCVVLACSVLLAAPVKVVHKEGVAHGFLTLRTLNGKIIADGELIQVTHEDQVTSELVLRFKDGSVHDEAATYSQRDAIRLLSDHLVQKGPSFPHPLDVNVDAAKREVTVHYEDKGTPKVESQQMDLPEDLANGLLQPLVKNIQPGGPPTVVSMVAATPKPRLVKLNISTNGKQAFTAGSSRRTATDFVIKVEIGGVAGVVAPLVGKQPPDTHILVYGGEAPAFLKFEGALYEGGPIWRIEPANLAWR